MEIRSEHVTLNVDDGTKMQAWTARPASGSPRAGLLVFQEAFGVNAHIRDVTERFAREGYLAIAPELFHRSAPPGFEGAYTEFPAMRPHLMAMKRENTQADQRAAYEWLRANGAGSLRVGAVGFCLGGSVAFLAGITLPLNCAISFYGGAIAANAMGPGMLGLVSGMNCPVLLFWGGADKNIPPESVRSVTEALREAGKNFVNVEISDADHGFFCDVRASYSPTAAALAWPLTLAFLKTHIS